MVVITEKGRIISSMKVSESLSEMFKRHKKKAKIEDQQLLIVRGEPNEKLKAEVKRRLEILQF